MSLSEENWTEATTSSKQAWRFPQAAMTTSREELTDIELKVIEGTLPDDLSGHAFIISPVGSVASKPLPGTPIYPSSDGTSLFNGDAMVYRLDFDRKNQAHLTSRLLKTPCYYADQASNPGTLYSNLRFYSSGLGRFSLILGFRNEVNTACIPIKFSRDRNWRLLATWDAGRPYEIDPVTLEVITPIGWNREWREQKIPLKYGPFRLYTTATHHVFDNHTDQLFMVNWGKSLLTMLFPLVIHALGSFLHDKGLLKGLFKQLFKIYRKLLQFLQLVFRLFGGESQDFVYLLCWDGVGDLQKWEVVLPNGLPVQIEQSMHQIGVTRNHIVLMDTAFKLGPEQLLPNPLPGEPFVDNLLRDVLNYPQIPDTNLYIVRRAELIPGKSTVVARQVVIPREIAHFIVDYDDSDGYITLHAAHNNAWDAAEWVQEYDKFVSHPRPSEPIQDNIHRLVGMTVSPTDLNLLGRYIIDPRRATIRRGDEAKDLEYTWGPAIYAHSSVLSLPQQYEDIYWNCWGCWQELLTQFIFDMYKNYKHRELNEKEVLEFASMGIPSNLCRLNTTSMQIVDKYPFPRNTFGNSPQFIPRSGGAGGSTDGYILCVVQGDNHDGSANSEFWIFDAANLQQGPVCKLGGRTKSLDLGTTIHTTWLPEIAPHTANYYIPVEEDYEPLLKTMEKQFPEYIAEVQELFEKEVYPHFKRNSSASDR
jgi:carotenoid cleavage dioxygenase-like enzyme